MEDLKHLMQTHFLQYASYVITDRAIPNVVDGLKPVQRRILHTLHLMDDGKLHKVANVAGQTMAFHPHGDAPINEALVNLANKGYLLDMQGNFGNLFTGDPAAAPRYIEARLSSLAKETLFNPDLTTYVPAYDGRREEPVCLPAKIPLLLLQGAEGIAVGMATHILPHNFVELLEAEIALLEGHPFELLPDFPTGGLMDASEYDKGKGKVKLRVKMEVPDSKTIVIREICYGTTTDSLTRSIDEAAKRGKIKIDSIHDYTSDKVEIEIKMPRGHYANELLDALYAYTECEVSLSSQIIVIKDNLPWDTDIHEILKLNVAKLQEILTRELEIEQGRLKDKVFQKTLEQLFIEHRIYKRIEALSDYEKIHEAIAQGLKPFHAQLAREPVEEDRERLLNMPIRRISRFDLEKNQEEIKALQERLEEVDKELKRIKAYTIRYLRHLLKKYGTLFPRRTEVRRMEEIDRKAIERHDIAVGFDPATGFVGTKVTTGSLFQCSNFDRLLILYQDGTYQVIAIPEKQYLHSESKVVYIGMADKKSVFSLVYHDPKNRYPYAKRFVVSQFILDKVYRYLNEGMVLDYVTTQPLPVVRIDFKPKPRQKVSTLEFPLATIAMKGVTAKGVRIANKEVKKVVFLRQQAAVAKEALHGA